LFNRFWVGSPVITELDITTSSGLRKKERGVGKREKRRKEREI
jgi:hypothetical protein